MIWCIPFCYRKDKAAGTQFLPSPCDHSEEPAMHLYMLILNVLILMEIKKEYFYSPWARGVFYDP